MPVLGLVSVDTRRLTRRMLGLGLLAVIAGGVALTIALYNHAFTSTVPVTLRTSTIGNQLIVPADVKLRGVEVGQVTSASSNGSEAVLRLELDPAQAKRIPANVVARILPKTLFGEKYVELVYPAQPSAQHLAAGDVIPEDRSAAALEIQQVFTQVVPLLRTLKPAELSVALTNLADALRGRGEQLGENLQLADRYFAQLNQHLPTIQHDISGLADLASSLNQAAPGLLEQAKNFAANARTVTEKKDAYAAFLRDTAGFADTATQVFGENAQNMIRLAQVSRPIMDTLAYYSPEFTCFLNGVANLEPRLEQDFAQGPYLHITLEYVPDRGAYTYPKDLPKYDTIGPPDCHGLPTDPKSSAYPSVYTSPPAANPSRTQQADLSIGTVGSPAEKAMVTGILAPIVGVPSWQLPADLADLLAGPLMRGMDVGLSS